jgi:ATP-binding cassette subfamily B (MDR/TAP) protein 1
LITDIFTAIAAISISFYYTWKLTLVLLASLPISAAILSFASKNLDSAIQSQKDHLQSASKVAAASITGIDHVTVCQSHQQEISRYAKAAALASKQYILQARCNAIQMGYVGFWVIGMFIAGFWYGLVLVEQGLQPGSVVTAFYAALAAFQGLESLLPNWLVFAKGMSAGKYLLMLRAETSIFAENANYQGTIQPAYFVGAVELQSVCSLPNLSIVSP